MRHTKKDSRLRKQITRQRTCSLRNTRALLLDEQVTCDQKKKKKEKGKDREKEKKSTGETDSNVCEDAWLFVTRETEEN